MSYPLPYATEKQLESTRDLQINDDRQYIENLFLYSTAPVIRGAKPAVLFRISTNYMSVFRQRQRALCKATNLKVEEMQVSSKSVLVFIYDQQRIEEALVQPLSLSILEHYGYDSSAQEFRTMLARLKKRLQTEDFPHEIGLFLGYPPEDVEAFIINGGKNCLLCRYWKVYHDVERAQEIFRQIDEAQSYALHLLHKPLPIHVAANRLKAM
ncbi:DUF3793 family protein [Scatolibacter rhodanostii]|uniref:DUF3793 family protein n=1 Tax=Scatolibacter rhodanostii TaxID=2014781 RepID=UPI0013564A2A|nr:DUF3793 family protein [Scatolibacter rhodanostii]